MQKLEIIKTKDGSCTLLNNQLGETYHSVNGAYTESMHVFITNGLLRFQNTKNDIHILEVGLGTGLNALLTMTNIPEGKTIYYTALEPFPIHYEMAKEYYNQFSNHLKNMDLFEKIFSAENNEFKPLSEHFFFRCSPTGALKLEKKEFLSTYASLNIDFNGFDIIYFDAFGPDKQPDMWTMDTLTNVCAYLKPFGILTSYCAQGQFKRNLKALNFKVEALPGPPGKREMTLAILAMPE